MISRTEALARIRASRTLWALGTTEPPEWLISSVMGGARLGGVGTPRASTSSKSDKARALVRQVVALANAKAEQGDTDGAIDVLNTLLRRTDLPDDVRALLTKARDRLVASKSADDAPKTVAALAASIEKLRTKVAAMRGEKETTIIMGTRNQNTAREEQRAKLAERMGMTQVPDVTLQQGAIVFGCISREDGRVLARMSPKERRELAAATGARKAQLWTAAKNAAKVA